MTHAPLPDADPADPRPFGAQKPRSAVAMTLWGFLYFAWVAFLVVMVLYYSGYGR